MFIVLEGIDGAGKGRQRNELTSYLSGKFDDITSLDFPNHENVLYKHLIHPVLHGEIKLAPKSWFLSFVLDQLMSQESIKAAKGSSDTHVIADGYFTTTIVYQCILEQVFTIKEALEIAKDFEVTPPDLSIYIDVDPEVALTRKLAEEGHDEGMDMYEGKLKKQKVIRSGFQQLVHEQIFCPWEQVDGSAGIEKVLADIIKKVEQHKLF
jgi:dTMP kinase